MATNYGDLYDQALEAYKAKPFAEQAKLSGFNFGGMDESGQAKWSAAAGDNIPFNSDAGETANSYVKSKTQFNSQEFFGQQGIIPIDPTLTNDGAYPGQPRMTPDAAQSWRDNWAKSFNQFGFNFNNYNDYLVHTTGPGNYVDDPKLGKVWVPDNRDSQTWNNDAMAASGKPQGNIIAKGVGNFLDNGGLVKAIGTAILAPGLSDLTNFGQNLITPDVPFDVGQNLVNNPEVFGSAGAAGAGTATAGAGVGGTSLLSAAKSAATLLSPLSSILSAGAANRSAEKMGGGSSINGTPAPTVTPPISMPTAGPGGSLLLSGSGAAAQRQSISDQYMRRGRASTFLTADSEKLGSLLRKNSKSWATISSARRRHLTRCIRRLPTISTPSARTLPFSVRLVLTSPPT